MQAKEAAILIYNLDDQTGFTFKTIKKFFAELKRQRFNDLMRTFIHLGFVKRIGYSYIRIRNETGYVKL